MKKVIFDDKQLSKLYKQYILKQISKIIYLVYDVSKDCVIELSSFLVKKIFLHKYWVPR